MFPRELKSPPANTLDPDTASADTVDSAVGLGFQAVVAPVRASTAARLSRVWPPIDPNSPPTYTVDPVSASASTSPSVAGVPGGREPGGGVQGSDAVTRLAADRGEVAAGVDGRARQRQRQHAELRRTALLLAGDGRLAECGALAPGSHAVVTPVRASSAAIWLRAAPPIAVNSPPAYTVEPDTASAATPVSPSGAPPASGFQAVAPPVLASSAAM